MFKIRKSFCRRTAYRLNSVWAAGPGPLAGGAAEVDTGWGSGVEIGERTGADTGAGTGAGTGSGTGGETEHTCKVVRQTEGQEDTEDKTEEGDTGG